MGLVATFSFFWNPYEFTSWNFKSPNVALIRSVSFSHAVMTNLCIRFMIHCGTESKFVNKLIRRNLPFNERVFTNQLMKNSFFFFIYFSPKRHSRKTYPKYYITNAFEMLIP